jgi:hypothetical protein
MLCASEHGTSAFVFSPDDTDNQFKGTPQDLGTDTPVCTISDLGRIVHVSHACGRSFLVHFGCGANLQAYVELQGSSELTKKCMVSLHSALLPPQMYALMRSFHRCVAHRPLFHVHLLWLSHTCALELGWPGRALVMVASRRTQYMHGPSCSILQFPRYFRTPISN